MSPFLLHWFTQLLSENHPLIHQFYKIRISLLYMQFRKITILDDNGPQATETQNDIPGNWWLNVIAIQSEVAQTRNTVIDRVVHSIDGNRTDVGAINTCKCIQNKN